MTDASADRLELRNVTKAFPGVLANDRVSFRVRPGELHALLGENGAGKSTLVKMIYGVQHPDDGEIVVDGTPVRIASPRAARAMGIGMVFQHFSLFEPMTVLENIALGLDERLSASALEGRIRAVLARYGLSLDPHRTVSTLSVGERQRIEIVRALLLEPRLLIMDEPTSVLTPQEVAQLFETLRALAAGGCSVLYISHKLHEIRVLCDAATIMRGGKVVGTCVPAQETPRSMAEMMIGGSLKDVRKAAAKGFGPEKLVVDRLTLAGGGDFDVALRDVSFSVRAGEILGIAGVAGNGQNELMLALSGETPVANAGAVRLDGAPVGTLPIARRRRRGLAAVPEERNGHAAVPGFTLAENAVLTARYRKGMVRHGVILGAVARGYAEEVIARFGVRATGPQAMAGALSGGNLQKFIMGREVLQVPEVLVVSQPTWGVDAGAAAAIHQALVDLAARGSAIVVVSQDLDELLAISDSLAVINEGRLSPKRSVGEISRDEIGLLMGGVHGEHAGGENAAEREAERA
ncbi:simple sugar transport system ATP-binding protein [Amaricoccus macauensis]|uniref:Simple sugar transport system ATP-binding protein n=1 Tax=Amaricoccus macauensis TaxID=57001 RepID=A0A840SK92_9RHOB|nr:ABC transporter ATP-binding protein [Amaricoccus macauensis]MBB5220306.1 simple sugar transport system ATP-binding protein [Amaricoccus macauensis]